MYQVQIPWNKIFKGLKYLLVLLILLGIGYVGYLTYYYATNSPYEVRVTNLTGSSATVSWYTNRPDGGVVYVKDKNSFTPVFPKFGSTVAYDDRDVAKAQEEWVNKQVSKATNDVDADYEISLDEKALNELPVKKKGKYYVHHVTINNLEEEKQYYFRVGNGVFMWNVNENNQKYSEYEAPTVKEFGFKTYKDPESLPSPSPTFGKVLSLAKNKDGYLLQNPSTDSVVFLKAWSVDNKVFSEYLSSVTNSVGGWTIDKSNLRNSKGEIVSGYLYKKDKLYAYAQLENIETDDLVEGDWGVSDAPMQEIIINNERTAQILGTLFDKVKLSLNDVTKFEVKLPYTYSTYAACGPDDVSECPAGYKFNRSSCSCVENKSPSQPSGNYNDTSDACVSLTCNDNQRKVGCGCVNKPKDPEEVLPRYERDDEPTGEVVETPKHTNVVNGCVSGRTTQLEDGTVVCANGNVDRAIAAGKSCQGRVANGCEIDAGCFCEFVDESGSSDGTGYARIAGESCRPAGCASVVNGDVIYSNGGERTRKYIDEHGNEILCGTDTTSHVNCQINKDGYTKGYVTTRGGKVICDEASGFALVGDECKQINPGNSNNGNQNPPEDIPNGENKVSQCEFDGKDFKDGNQNLTGDQCGGLIMSYIRGDDYCDENGKVKDRFGGCSCAVGFERISTLNGGFICEAKSNSVAENEKCKFNDNVSFNCGGDRGGDYYCGKASEKGGCSAGQSCLYVENAKGFCSDVSESIGFQYLNTPEAYGTDYDDLNTLKKYIKDDEKWALGANYDCYLEIGSTGEITNKVITQVGKKPTDSGSKTYAQAWVTSCLDGVETIKPENTYEGSMLTKVNAKSNIDVETVDNKLIIFPESGTYDIQFGNQKFSNIYIDKNNKNFFYKEVNGKPGYQLPKDPKKPGKSDDVLLPASGAVVTLYEKAKNQSMKLSKGINIVSFNYLPSRVEGKNMNAKQLMRILNSSGTKVTRITTFEGGKWLGGLAYDANKGEIVGNDFLVLPGKGYLIVSNTDYTATVPGYGIKNSIPVALSDGWNLIGVNGYSKTYTAASMIKTVNEIEGLGANNVTWWPTSKGRYESFQKSEGTEYGFDFPLLKDVGYFVRINKFDREGAKSVIWNPGGDLHGENGSK